MTLTLAITIMLAGERVGRVKSTQSLSSSCLAPCALLEVSPRRDKVSYTS